VAPLLQIENLSISLPAGADRALAVDGVSLALNPREIVCVVGESGSGKSTLAHAVLGLLPRGLRIAGGDIRLGELQLAGMPLGELRRVRGKRIAMVFQEPLSALNPLMRCGHQIGEMLRTHGMRNAAQVNARRRAADFGRLAGPCPHRRLLSLSTVGGTTPARHDRHGPGAGA